MSLGDSDKKVVTEQCLWVNQAYCSTQWQKFKVQIKPEWISIHKKVGYNREVHLDITHSFNTTIYTGCCSIMGLELPADICQIIINVSGLSMSLQTLAVQGVYQRSSNIPAWLCDNVLRLFFVHYSCGITLISLMIMKLNNNNNKKDTLTQAYLFMAIAANTMGAISSDSMEFLDDLSRRITQVTAENLEKVFLTFSHSSHLD